MKGSVCLSFMTPESCAGVRACVCVLPRCHGRSNITISHAVLRASQLCGHCVVSVRALSHCAHSMQETSPPPPFFFSFSQFGYGKRQHFFLPYLVIWSTASEQ